MVHVLKNLSIRLWISVAAGGLATLGLLAMLGSPLEPAFNLFIAATLTILAYLSCGWILNRIVLLKLQDCLREATSRERTARVGEAAEAFRKAIILFDSFMVSPLLRRRMGRELSGRVARFHIARAVRSQEAETFITSYLWAYPNDAEVADYWLQHTRLGENADPEHLGLADRIAAAQPENLEIHSLIANTYLARRRTDYTALQVYKKLLQESSHTQGPTVEKLAELFLREARSDEWALEVYLKAHTQDPAQTDYLKGLAACLGQIRQSERNESLLMTSREVLHNVDQDTILKWQASFRQMATPSELKEPSRTLHLRAFFYGFARNLLKSLARATEAIFMFFSSWIETTGNYWRESHHARQIVRWAAVLVFAAIVVVSAISTIYYIRETKEPPETASAPAKPKPQMATSGRYTVQVASFRNSPQAISFADRLQQLGYPAYWGESSISPENVWFFVRISRFEVKQKAKEFAEELKSKDIIDDFYITNYKEP